MVIIALSKGSSVIGGKVGVIAGNCPALLGDSFLEIG